MCWRPWTSGPGSGLRDGYIGYVENRKLEAGEQIAPVSTFEAPVYTSISMDGKVRLGFHQVTRQEGNNTLEDYASNARGMNVIVPTGLMWCPAMEPTHH